MIIDCHVHLNNYTEQEVPTEASLQRLLSDMEANNVDRAFVLTSYLANERRPRVEKIIDMAREHPQLYVVEGVSLSGGAPLDLRAMEDRLRTGQTIGLKFYPGYEHFYPTDRLCEPIYELATKYRVPVMFHTGDTYTKRGKIKYSHPLHLDDVAVDHPDMRIVVCHLGNPWFRDTAELVYKNDNVMADISGLILGNFEARFERWLADQVRDVILYAGDPEDLLFGTDWPLVEMAPYQRFVKSLALSEEEERMLMRDNAWDWFRLDEHEKRRGNK